MVGSYLFLFLTDLMIGMNTNAPDKMMVRIKGPSIRGVPVNMMKQMDTQSKVSKTICEFESGFFML